MQTENALGNAIVAIIPARYGASRFPGKPLALIDRVPMVVRVMERTRSARGISRVLVATDDDRIAEVVRRAGGEAVMTRGDHVSGTERLAEVAVTVMAPFYLNVQGDEPLIEPAALEALVSSVADAPVDGNAPGVATLATPVRNSEDAADPHVVKVVLNAAGNALYFSRAAIPHRRGSTSGEHAPPVGLKHLGVYLYSREVLLAFATLPPGHLERIEQLEQLRLLENGYAIRVVVTPYDSVSVDVPEDVARVEALLRT